MNKHTDTVQWLLENPRFIDWVTERCPDDDYWATWAAEDPSRQEMIKQAVSLINRIEGKKVTVTDAHIDRSIQQALLQAKRQEVERAQPQWQPMIFRPEIRWIWAVAATIILLIGIGWLFVAPQSNQSVYDQQIATVNQRGNTYREIKNDGQPLQYVQLPDGSSVLLQKNSRISFPVQFATGQREVYLTGEAFFEVAKNPKQPFLVYANELVAKVLGTSFAIKAPANASDFTIVVKTGKVAVFSQKDSRSNELKTSRSLTGLVLLPNHQVTFDRKASRMTQAAIDEPTLLNIPIEKEAFSYQETPVATLFADLEKAYGVKIDFDREVMAHCSVTATLGDDPLTQKLSWICKVLEASYDMQDGHIRISGKPCQ